MYVSDPEDKGTSILITDTTVIVDYNLTKATDQMALV